MPVTPVFVDRQSHESGHLDANVVLSDVANVVQWESVASRRGSFVWVRRVFTQHRKLNRPWIVTIEHRKFHWQSGHTRVGRYATLSSAFNHAQAFARRRDADEHAAWLLRVRSAGRTTVEEF